MEPKFVVIKDRSGKEWLYGIYRPEGMKYGRNGIRKSLCSLEDAEFKHTKRGPVVRTDQEYKNYTHQLYYKKLQEILEEKEKATKEPRSPSIQKAFQQFLDEQKNDGDVTQETIESYIRAFNFYIETLGNHPINQYKKQYRGTLVNALQNKPVIEPMTKKVLRVGLGPVTINSLYITKYNKFFAWAFEEELIDRQIRLKRAKVEKKKMTGWSTEAQLEIERLLIESVLSANKQSKKGALSLLRTYMMIAETGMRRAEVWSLKLNRIDLSAKRIQVRSVPDVGYKIKEGAEKDIPISDFLIDFLKQDFEKRSEKEVWYLDDGSGNIHPKRKGSLTKAFTDFLKKHELYSQEIKPFHGFRSRAISMVIQKKGIAHAQFLVGHQNIRTTENYLDTKFLDMDEVVNALRDHRQITVSKDTDSNTQ